MPKFVLFSILLPGVFAHAETMTPGSLEAKLYHELLAPCCYRETLDHHMSDTSTALKTEIHGLLADGKSEGQILELYNRATARGFWRSPKAPCGGSKH